MTDRDNTTAVDFYCWLGSDLFSPDICSLNQAGSPPSLSVFLSVACLGVTLACPSRPPACLPRIADDFSGASDDRILVHLNVPDALPAGDIKVGPGSSVQLWALG